MKEFECRLCSATNSLISLFSGKSRKNRDIIRKLVSETVQIQFEEGDVHSCICYNCVIHVYNFYIFQVRTQDNEQRLQEAASELGKPFRGKHIIIPLEVLPLPSIKSLKETFTPWLQEKLQVITEEQLNTSSNSRKSPIPGANGDTQILMKDQGTQILPSTQSKETQSDKFEQKHKSTQFENNLETKDVGTQVKTKTSRRGIQCNLGKDNTSLRDKDIQCHIVTEHILKHEISSQCQEVKNDNKTTCTETDLKNCNKLIYNSAKSSENSGICKRTRRKFAVHNNFLETKLRSLVNGVDNKLQFLESTGLTLNKNCQSNLIVENNDDEEIDFGLKKTKIQLVNNSVQCDISKDCGVNVSNESTQIEIPTDEIGLQTDTFTSLFVDESVQTDLPIQESSVDLKSVLNTKNEMLSPIPSPTKSLNISVEVSCKNESSTPTFGSPRTSNCFSPDLLEVTNKVNVVKVCKECDFLMYSKAEAKEHRKLHVKCKLCKKSFRSIKKMKEHFRIQCDAKLRTMMLRVNITRMDLSTVATNHTYKNQQDFTVHTNVISYSQPLSPPGKKIKLK